MSVLHMGVRPGLHLLDAEATRIPIRLRSYAADMEGAFQRVGSDRRSLQCVRSQGSLHCLPLVVPSRHGAPGPKQAVRMAVDLDQCLFFEKKHNRSCKFGGSHACSREWPRGMKQ